MKRCKEQAEEGISAGSWDNAVQEELLGQLL